MELELVRRALDLGALAVGGAPSRVERGLATLASQLPPAPPEEVARLREALRAGEDPLGEGLLRARSPRRRRQTGTFFTPPPLVRSMLTWVLARDPGRLVDPGCGSGRFAAAAARARPELPIVAVDLDPVATLLTRAALGAVGARHVRVVQADYTRLQLFGGDRTAFIGNPPYVRHHDLPPGSKTWAAETARALERRVSGLAGLHALFYLKTAAVAKKGDLGAFVTSAEWLDVGYGALIRELLLEELGGHGLHVVDPKAAPWTDAMATAAITCFEVGARPSSMRLRRVARPELLDDLERGRPASRRRLAAAQRWSPLLRRRRPARPAARKLGDVARVHRGVATGCNRYFVLTRREARELGIERRCSPVVTSARQIQAANGVLRAPPEDDLDARLLLDVPPDIDRARHAELHRYLLRGERRVNGEPAVAARYLPSHRTPWWRLALSPAPPIVASYMARQPPVFALNPDRLAVLNIAHGVYPIEPLPEAELEAMVAALNKSRAEFTGAGRTYHGGLEKFEPREMELLPLTL